MRYALPYGMMECENDVLCSIKQGAELCTVRFGVWCGIMYGVVCCTLRYDVLCG